MLSLGYEEVVKSPVVRGSKRLSGATRSSRFLGHRIGDVFSRSLLRGKRVLCQSLGLLGLSEALWLGLKSSPGPTDLLLMGSAVLATRHMPAGAVGTSLLGLLALKGAVLM
ncbi:hypothetical protein GB937_010555 [Aspergillus fischeri]|nr:hypothetical protein GB937_010555 [Aspergillus fischeri]